MCYSVNHIWDMKWIEFKAKSHKIILYRINKISLSSNNDKKIYT